MYRIKLKNTCLAVNKSYEGETIEQKVERIKNNKEPIKDGAPLIYHDRKEGVKAAFNIRTDRWDIAAEATDKITGAARAKRENKPDIGKEALEGMKKENGGAEPTQAT